MEDAAKEFQIDVSNILELLTDYERKAVEFYYHVGIKVPQAALMILFRRMQQQNVTIEPEFSISLRSNHIHTFDFGSKDKLK